MILHNEHCGDEQIDIWPSSSPRRHVLLVPWKRRLSTAPTRLSLVESSKSWICILSLQWQSDIAVEKNKITCIFTGNHNRFRMSASSAIFWKLWLILVYVSFCDSILILIAPSLLFVSNERNVSNLIAYLEDTPQCQVQEVPAWLVPVHLPEVNRNYRSAPCSDYTWRIEKKKLVLVWEKHVCLDIYSREATTTTRQRWICIGIIRPMSLLPDNAATGNRRYE